MVLGDVLLPAAGKGELQPAVRRAADVDAARAHAVMVIGGKGRRLLAHQQHKRDPPRKAVSEAVPLLQGLIRVGYARMAQAGGAGAGKMPAARRRQRQGDVPPQAEAVGAGAEGDIFSSRQQKVLPGGFTVYR